MGFRSTSVIFVLILISLSGCTTLYKQQSVYSPMLMKRGDLNLNAALSMSGSGWLTLNTAYAVSDRFGIMAGRMYHTYRERTGGWSFNTTSDKLNIYSVELAPGYNMPLSNEGKWHLQCYAGGGWGDSRVIGQGYVTDPAQTQPEASASFYNYFVQPGIFLNNKQVMLGLDVKANYVDMYDVVGNFYDHFDWWNTEYHYSDHARIRFMLLEPNITLKVGGKHIKALFQAGPTIPLYRSDEYYSVNSLLIWNLPPPRVVFGLSYTFTKKEPAVKF